MDSWASIRDWADYPSGFIGRDLTKHTVKNKLVLEELRKIAKGEWHKVYQDGTIAGKKVSLHYFQHKSGRVALPKQVFGWSNSEEPR